GRGGADGDGSGDAVGILGGPGQRLHAADGAADDGVQPVDAEVVDDLGLGADDVEDGHDGEIAAVASAGGGGGRGWPGRAVAGAEDVDADDGVAGDVEGAAGAEQFDPPVADAGGAGEGVADEDGVVASGVEVAVDGVAHGDRGQSSAGGENEGLVLGEG